VRKRLPLISQLRWPLPSACRIPMSAIERKTKSGGPGDADPGPAQEAIRLLEPFERLGHVFTPRALALLAWARRTL
jgi:hypothetical protein